MNENEVFPDLDEIEILGKATDPMIETVARLTEVDEIVWKKEVDYEDDYYYTIMGEPPETWKLEFQGVSFNVDQHSFILWRKQLKPIQADQLRFVIRNNWKRHLVQKRKRFQEMLAEKAAKAGKKGKKSAT